MFSFCRESGRKSVALKGTIEEIVSDAARLIAAGVDGIDLTAYRYVDGDPLELARAVGEKIGMDKLAIAGSVGSKERMDQMARLGAMPIRWEAHCLIPSL